MKKYLAKMLRRAADELDPQPEPPLYVLTPNYGASATNTHVLGYSWTAR